jgi:hypothetical protein
LIVRGIDLLGQPFEERTSTLALNLHGCRYVSKHHLPKNSWVTLEVPEEPRQHMRARVAWIQRPHSVREFFQIAVELESPSNIWNVSSPPEGWQESRSDPQPRRAEGSRFEQQFAEPTVSGSGHSTERFGPNMTNEYSQTASEQALSEGSPAENPLLLQWSVELERQAAEVTSAAVARAAERIERAIEEFSRLENNARERFSTQASETHSHLAGLLAAEFERGFERIRELIQTLDQVAEMVHTGRESALEAADRLSQSRREAEAAEAIRAQSQAETAQAIQAPPQDVLAMWRESLEAAMAVAGAQWNELLQSSLDSNIGRLVEQLAGRSQELLRSAERGMSERFAELREPLNQTAAEARDALSSLRSALQHELARTSSSLTEIEHATTRMREHSAQLETTSHNTLDEMHRRLENILQAQTDEMGRRAEQILGGAPERVSALVDSIAQHTAERAIREIDSKLTPRVERAAQLADGLGSRGAEADESLRLHRERLRQMSENNLREAAAQTAATISGLRGDFESARKEALGKWNEELDASGVRASHAASESIERSSEWFQQETRARMQVLLEQAVASASGALEEKAAEAARQFEARLKEQSSGRISQIHEDLNGLATEISGRTRSQLEQAAEAAGASFGEVLRRVSGQEAESFTTTSRKALADREREFGVAAAQLLQNLESNAQATLEQFRAQMASQLVTSIAEGRTALSAEFATAINDHRAEREAHEKGWADALHRLGDEAVGRHQDRLQNAGDSWVASSVRRLNEDGQSAIESLMQSADQAVRESCAKLFQGLSQMLQDVPAKVGGSVGSNLISESEGEPSSESESANGANA